MKNIIILDVKSSKYYGYHNNMLVRAYGTLYMPEEEYQKYEKVTSIRNYSVKIKRSKFLKNLKSLY